MPYYVSDENPDCSGWAVEKDDGEVIGCHDTKQAAIDQMVAVSIAEEIEPGGERALPDELSEGDFVRWRSSGGTARGRVEHIMREGTLGVPDSSFSINAEPDNPAALIRIYRPLRDGWQETETLVGHRFSTLTKIDPLPEPSPEDEDRQVNLDLPSYIRQAAARGLEFYEEGLGGDGLVERTIREARAMARGEISEDKVVRVSAWAARHEPDLRAEGARPDDDGFPTPGAVAHYLWGIPTGGRYDDARAWFDRKAEQVKAEQDRAVAPPVEPRSKDSGVEFRQFTAEMRQLGDGNTFVGYAARFNSDSQPLPFIERIAPGAFRKTLGSKRDVRLFINHDSGQVLASKRSGTLRLEEDEKGLRVEADMPDTQAARDLKDLMRRGIVDSMSFGFSVPRGGDSWSDDGSRRELREITLHEVSVVTGFPAYEATSAAVRSLEAVCERTGMSVDEIAQVLERLADKPEDAQPDQPNLLDLKRKRSELLSKKPL